jgi:hypothetical protein
MSRRTWRVSRAFRVVLACLALWLPARSASAWTVAADPVVMVGGAAGTTAALSRPIADTRSEARRRATTARRAPLRELERGGQRSAPSCPTATASRTVAPPLYLLHCALLR